LRRPLITNSAPETRANALTAEPGSISGAGLMRAKAAAAMPMVNNANALSLFKVILLTQIKGSWILVKPHSEGQALHMLQYFFKPK
jgi:hypothetical protein